MLLDQSFSAGVGNWVADEVLYQSRIHPETSAAALSDAQVTALHAALQLVIRTANEALAAGKEFPAEWLFHHRWTNKAQGSKDFYGHPITFLTVGSRTSAVVPALQKKTDAGGDAGVGAGRGSAKTSKKGARPTEPDAEGSSDREEGLGGGASEGAGPGPTSAGVAKEARSKRARTATTKNVTKEEQMEGDEERVKGTRSGGKKAAAATRKGTKRAAGASEGGAEPDEAPGEPRQVTFFFLSVFRCFPVYKK